MKRITIVLVGAVILLSPVVLALATDGYDLSWWTADSGGGSSTTGSYTLSGTAGQPDASALAGGSYTLTGGFWSATSQGQLLYLPIVRRAP
jgi:hypothetical protein